MTAAKKTAVKKTSDHSDMGQFACFAVHQHLVDRWGNTLMIVWF